MVLRLVTRRRDLRAVLLTAVILAGCGTRPTLTSPVGTSPAAPPPTPTALPSASPVPSLGEPSRPIASGFAFDAESIAGYYQTQGYSCSEPRPSTQALGYTVVTCQLMDLAGRRRDVGLVTDPAGELANGFASVRGAAGEDILNPADALEPLAGFLGAMLGESRGESLLPWLAGHLGDEFERTTIDDLEVATYLATPDDHSTLFVEIANQAYIDAPRPSST